MKYLDGRLVSKARLEELKRKLGLLSQSLPRPPSLHVIRVGHDPASEVYVKKKVKTCIEIGMKSEEHHLASEISGKELADLICRLNDDEHVDGILLQLPLPSHLDANHFLQLVNPDKDVDGFHPMNLGRLVAQEEGFVPCTPLGIMKILEYYEIPLEGCRAVVVGRSRIVGRPCSLLLDHAGATVTVVHKSSPQPELICSQADLLVVAAGVKHLIGADSVKEGAVVIDVGIHRETSGKLTGDVDFEKVKDKVSAITPVPGGVGPMTISSLLENTFLAYSKKFKIK